MTPADRAARSRASQGLPEHVVDPAVLARIAALIAARQGDRHE